MTRNEKTAGSDVVICEPLRTPIGRYGGALKGLQAADLGTQLLSALVSRTGLNPDRIEDVIVGHSYPTSEAPALGRVIALNAGLPTTVPGMQIDRRCASGLQAVLTAAQAITAGHHELVIAGGVESMSNAPHYSMDIRNGKPGDLTLHDSLARGRATAGGFNHPVAGGMLETAENLRRLYDIGREDQDRLAALSHQRAVAAQESGVFAEEIVPVTAPQGRESRQVEVDEHPRPGTTVEGLAKLRPVLSHQDPEATVTAGNASGQNDGAALAVLTTRRMAEELGLTPSVRLVSAGLAGVGPATMGIGPVPATGIALARAGLTLDDMDLIELNEAFAAQVLACTAEWRLGERDFDRINVHGSGISLGHPVGATGARILTTLARSMVRQDARFGLETMCIGGGQGLAAVFELA